MIAAAWIVARPAREPEYDGVPLSDYLRSLTYSQVRLERSARDAIRAIGSNAVPHLVKILDARESRFKTSFNETADRQSFIRFRFTPLAARQTQAAMACQELGPIAAPAIPSLAKLIDDPELGMWAIAAVAEIGPQTFPLLTNALRSRHIENRLAAVGCLRFARPRERAVVPLLAALHEQEYRMRAIAAESLGALGLPSPAVLTALTACLDDRVTDVRLHAARSLGWFGASATGSFSKLLDLHRSLGSGLEKQYVGEALFSIDPAAAEKADLQK